MNRELMLKIVLVLVGLLFTAAIYPAVAISASKNPSDTGDGMMMSIYCALGIFLLLAARNPPEHRSLIAFAAWSSFAHAAAMGTMGLHMPDERFGFLVGSGVLVVIEVVILALMPPKRPVEHSLRASA